MLSFILLVNALIIFYQKLPTVQEDAMSRHAARTRLEKQQKAPKPLPMDYTEKILSDLAQKEKKILIWLNLLAFAGLFIFGLGLFLDIRFLMARIRGQEFFRSKDKHIQPNWTVGDILRLSVIFIFLSYLVQIIQILLLPASASADPGFMPLINTAVMDLAIFGFILYFVSVKYRQGLAALGLKLKNSLRSVFQALLSYTAFLPVLAVVFLLLTILASIFDYSPAQQILFEIIFNEKGVGALVFLAVLVVLIGPIVEEVFFRGFAYSALKKRCGVRKAMVLTAVIFAALHANLFGFLPIMLLGFLLAFVYEKTGSLISSITIHALHNGLMLGLSFLGRFCLT